jgi:anti-sigma factor RsiW
MKCWQVQKYLHAHLDGELGADLSLEIEKHLAECGRCRQQMDFEIHFIDRIRTELRTPNDTRELEDGIRKALAAEGKRRSNVKIFAKVAVLAAAASIILVVGVLVRGSIQRKEDLPPIGLSEEIVKNHSHSKPLEINADDEKEVARWFEGKLDFPVDPPKFAPDANVRLVGARISRIKAKDAAQLVYDVGGHKVTFMIFDPGKDVKALGDGRQDLQAHSQHGRVGDDPPGLLRRRLHEARHRLHDGRGRRRGRRPQAALVHQLLTRF